MKENSRTEDEPNMQRGNLLKRGNWPVVLASFLMVALALLAGCAPRASSAGTTTAATTADDSKIVIDLPALVLDVQPDGSLNVGGKPITQLGGSLGASLASANIPATMVDSITGLKIQHIQIDNTPDGLLILVNGQAIPSLAWDGEKLVATAQVLEQLGSGVALLDRVLPLIQDVGVGVILRFPLAQGETPLPMVAPQSDDAAKAIQAQKEFLDAVGTPPVVHFTIAYNADGTWTIADVNQTDLTKMLNVPATMLNLTPQTIASVTKAHITDIGLSTNKDGIFITINGKTLPYLTWADGRVSHLLTLAKDTGLLNQVLGSSPDMAGAVDTIESLLPAIQASDVSLKVTFPQS